MDWQQTRAGKDEDTMDSIEKGKASLISSIEKDALSEEQKIIEDAQTQVAERKKYTEKKIESMLNDARQKGQEQAQEIKRKAISDVELEIKRRSLRARKDIIQEILNRAGKKLYALIDTTEYKEVLIEWIIQAALGLNADSVLINASEKERIFIDESLLSDANEKISALTGQNIKFTPSDAPPLESQGISLSTENGRLAFNNQVKTRMLRKQSDIQKLIHDLLFAGEK